MQQGVQRDVTCNNKAQCRDLLANNVASVCTGLNKLNDPPRTAKGCIVDPFTLIFVFPIITNVNFSFLINE